MDSPNGLAKLKVVESTVFEIIGRGGGGSTPSPFLEGVGTKYLRTGRVNEGAFAHASHDQETLFCVSSCKAALSPERFCTNLYRYVIMPIKLLTHPCYLALVCQQLPPRARGWIQGRSMKKYDLHM